jgi:hypothetical protein
MADVSNKQLPPIDIPKLIANALNKSARGRMNVFDLFEEQFLFQVDHPSKD